MDIFIDKEKRPYLTIIIYYCKYEINGQENFLFFHSKEAADVQIHDRLKKITAKFLVPNFQEHADIKKKSVFQTQTGNAAIHDASYAENILKSCLKKIITDDYEMEMDETNYGELHPSFGDALYLAFSNVFLNPSVQIQNVLDNNKIESVE